LAPLIFSVPTPNAFMAQCPVGNVHHLQILREDQFRTEQHLL
jgi:hypothetical protein